MNRSKLPGIFVFLQLFVFGTKSVLSQISGGFESNSSYYIDDNKIKLEQAEANNRFRSNNYLRLDYTFGHFTAGIQAESYQPKSLLNYSPKFRSSGLGTYYLNYKNDTIGLDLTIGHFYEQFGSGLVLRSWEDRQLGIANSLVGAKIKYSPLSSVVFTALYGKQRNGLGFDFSDGVIGAVNADIDLSAILKAKKINYSFGWSYVSRNEQIEKLPTLSNPTYLTSARFKFKLGGFTTDFEYAFKSKDALVEYGNIRPEFEFDGDAYLLNIGYTQKGFGINANLRRTENFNAFSQRNLSGNIYNEGLINYVPALTKQYDYSLTNIYVYAAQPFISFEPNRNKAGEIGGQFDLIYQFSKGKPLGGKYGTNISINYAQWHGLRGLYDAAQRKYKAEPLGLGTKYYQDIGIEIRKKWTNKFSSIITYLHQYYNARFVEESLGEVRTNTIAVENTIKNKKNNSIRFELQHQFADAGFGNWAAAQFEYNTKQGWSFFVADLYNYGNNELSKKIHYYNSGVVLKKGSGRYVISYGRQRGGLICVGGVCRFVPQSAGFNASINWSF